MAVTKKGRGWFQSMSPAAQKEYIKRHPNSIYAPGNKSKIAQGLRKQKVDPQLEANRKQRYRLLEQREKLREQLDHIENRMRGAEGSELENLRKKRDALEDKYFDISDEIKKLKAK